MPQRSGGNPDKLDGTIFKIRLSDFAIVEKLAVHVGQGFDIGSAVSDGTYAYFGTWLGTIVVRLRLSDFTLAGTRPSRHLC